MKIASYNVENLFDRAKAFNSDTAAALEVPKKEAELNSIFQQAVYSPADKTRILELMKDLGILRSDEGPFVLLRKIRGKLIRRPQSGNAFEILASGRDSWLGWVELKTAPVNAIAILNTGRVLKEVNADILAVIEAENRIALKQFSDFVLKQLNGTPYENVMLIDGNDDRGIDVGLMTRQGFDIELMRSHINDKGADGKAIFSRDCPEYCVRTPQGEEIWVLPNHFKSKFGGNDPASQNKRLVQAARTSEIYNRLIAEGKTNVVVLGDLNDTPGSIPITALLSTTTLRDVSDHPSFDTGSFAGRGTFGLGNDNQKIDYLLLSPGLFARVTASGLFRKGAWPGAPSNPRWEVFPQLKLEVHAASDHHLIWCEMV